MANTTTATQRRDRRRELEEKYGLRSTTTTNTMASTFRDENLNDNKSGFIRILKNKREKKFIEIFYRNSSIKIIIKF